MMNFCTLFDSNYISKGIALYLSLERNTRSFHLYVMAMDRKCENTLKAINFKHLTVECIEDIEEGELLEAKLNRTRAEYCWTCGSVVTEYFFRTKNLPDITYLDSDLMFFSSPECIDEELKEVDASIGLSPHFINNTIFGIYCVQYVFFKKDKNGEACLNWWKEECLKWCYSKLENGKYGDQKYLDYMEDMFDNVYALKNRGIGIANWNQEQYIYNASQHTLTHEGKEWPIVFFHYNGVNVKIEGNKLVFVISKYFTKPVRNLFIKEYASLLMEVFNTYLSEHITGYTIRPQSRIKLFLNRCFVHIRRNKACMRLEKIYMEHKYAQRKSPYSER